MTGEQTLTDFDELFHSLRRATQRLVEIDAAEGAAGNLSYYFEPSFDPSVRFPNQREIQLPVEAPALKDGWLLMSGSGQRMRDIAADPQASMGLVKVEADGKTGQLYTCDACRFTRLTTEFNSHLAVHNDQVALNGYHFLALAHAQPKTLTFFSHTPRYQDQDYFNRHLLRWQPETIMNFPTGIGVAPFAPPASPELMEANVRLMRDHTLVVWSRHGVMSKSTLSMEHAVDLIEYAETAARYELMNLNSGEIADGLSTEQIRTICLAFNIKQTVF